MSKTLEENGIDVLDNEMIDLGIDPAEHIPVIHLYFADDLTEG